LPTYSLCLSRFRMDAVLACYFRELGGDLQEHSRSPESAPSEGVVRATGRQSSGVENDWKWFGLKVHAHNVQLQADLEMHAGSNGYIGLCRLADGELNICGLFRRRVDSPPAHSWRETLLGQPGSLLRSRLENAVVDERSFCSVGGLSLNPARASQRAECRIGDALTMIPPVTGNGMSMAFEAAQLAVEPLAAFSRGEASWSQAARTIAWACDRAFARRLARARWLQRLMFFPGMSGPLGGLALRSNGLWKWFFHETRQ
jgi:2-polyprenyl-6-methoxyphenol hydroxylase-like FAD-dependent oxidoreductase